jgi:nucleoside-diphosphate-sugar epimerase
MMIEESLSEMSEIRFGKKESASRKGNFEKLLIEAVDNVFSSLGDSCKQAIYFHLKDCYNVSKHEIPYRIEDFADALEKIFGLGAKLIEIEIMRALFAKVQDFSYSPKQEDLSFTNYVETWRGFSQDLV